MNIIYNDDKLCRYDSQRERGEGLLYRVIEDLPEEPITVEFFKAHARIDYAYDDALCNSYIKAARQELEQWSQLSFGVKTIELTALRLPNNFELMYGYVDSVTGYDNLGNTLLNAAGRNVTIEYTTKWEPLPETVKIAIARHAASLYMIREGIIIDDNGKTQKMQENEAKQMLRPYMNITLL